MKRTAAAILLAPLLAASAPAQAPATPLEQALKEAQSEQASAEAETRKLEQAAERARSESERLLAREQAAARAIDASEARISAADVQYRLAAARVEEQRQLLAEEQRPVSSLLAGLAVMARRPPLLVLADGGGTDDLVRVSVLLDSTLPVIRSRTRVLSGQLEGEQRLEAAALSARAELVRSRQELGSRREQFAELERQAYERSLAAGGQALSTGDVAIAAGEQIQQLRTEQSSSRSARDNAILLAAEPPAPPRPVAAAGSAMSPPFAYALPVSAPVIEGLGAVNDSGVRARGIIFAAVRGTPVSAPAGGLVRYSGPFHDYDGIVILDHGGGWITLIVNVSSQLKAGDKISIGDPLGRAIGPVEVELSHNGQRFSPALIAGSSRSLSKALKRG